MEQATQGLLIWSISNIVMTILIIRFFIYLSNQKVQIERVRGGLYSFIMEWDRYHNGTKIEIEKVLKFKLLKNGK